MMKRCGVMMNVNVMIKVMVNDNVNVTINVDVMTNVTDTCIYTKCIRKAARQFFPVFHFHVFC